MSCYLSSKLARRERRAIFCLHRVRCVWTRPLFVVWLELGKIGGKAPLEGAFFCKTNKKLWLHQLKDTPIQCQFVGPCNNIFYKLVTKHSWKTFVPCFAFFVITWSGRCVPLWMEAAVNIVCRASSSEHRAQLGAGTAATLGHPRVALG